MPSFRNEDPMCKWNPEQLRPGDAKRKREGNEDVTQYRDGTSTRHCGGPNGGDFHYDENGEEI